MAGIGPGDLYDLAEELLDVCTEALDTIPTFSDPPYLADLEGAPSVRFVSPGPPYPDCCDDGQLIVHTNNVTDRFARQQDAGAPKLNVPSLIVTLLRCYPIVLENGELAPASEMTGFAKQHSADGWALWNHIYNLIEAEQFLTRCSRVEFQSMQALQVEGTCGGWQLQILAQLDGYREDLTT